jgi:serine protease Do
MESNTPSHSRAGFELQELTEDLKEHFGVTNGTLVVRVQDDGPAARAGIQAMDLIVKLGDLDLTSARELTAGINGTPPETELQLTVRRGVRERSLLLKTEAMPPVTGERPTEDTEGISIRIVETGTSEGGVSIDAISPHRSANRLGLRTGDAIRAVNGTTVRNRSDFLRLQRNTTSGKSQLWEVWRFDRVFFVAVRDRVTVL